LSDPAKFYKQVGAIDALDIEDKELLKVNADRLFNRFKDYLLAVVTLGDMSIEDVAPIFERINSTGTALTIVDLMRAATWSTDFDLIDSIDTVRDSLVDKDFGGVDRKVVLRSLSAAAGGGFSADSIDELRNHDADVLKSATREIDESFRLAVDYLSTQISIPSDSIIPYANQLVILSEIYRLLPSPSGKQLSAINKWFWRTSVSGYFSGWNTGNMATDHKAVKKFCSGETGEIEVDAIKPNSEIWKARQYRSNGAHAKTLGIVLAYQKPIDLLTGAKIDTSRSLAWQNSREYHHFFPRDYLRQNGVSAREANCLANIVMLTSSSNKKISNRAPSDYLKETVSNAGDATNAWLDTNLISDAALAAAMQDDFASFIAIRCKDIEQKTNSLAQWERD